MILIIIIIIIFSRKHAMIDRHLSTELMIIWEEIRMRRQQKLRSHGVNVAICVQILTSDEAKQYEVVLH